MAFQDKFRELRTQNGLSQEQLAMRLNVSRQAISKWETGSVPDVDNMVKIAKFFDCSLDYLMDMKKEEPEAEQAQQEERQKFMTPDRVALLLACTALVILAITWLISRFVDVPIFHHDMDTDRWYVGFQAFAEYYRIMPLIYGCIGVWIAGMTVRLGVQLNHNRYVATRKYFVCKILAYILWMLATLEWISDFHQPGGFVGFSGGVYAVICIYFCVIIGLEFGAGYIRKTAS